MTTAGGAWADLPLDVLVRVFSFLPPDSVARAARACRHWRTCHRLLPPPSVRWPPWLIAMPARSPVAASQFCYARDPITGRWRVLPLDFVSEPVRPITAVSGSLLLCKVASSPELRLSLVDPFSRHYSLLPNLLTPRRNPAIGVVAPPYSPSFRIVVAGGTSSSGTSYELTAESFDSVDGRWSDLCQVPTEFAVRLTVWTPNESALVRRRRRRCLYWITSARAYSIVELDLARLEWSEVKAPAADQLRWAALVVRRNGRLGVIGDGRIWEMDDEGGHSEWKQVEAMPEEMETRFSSSACAGAAVAGVKCVGDESGVYLFRELGAAMVAGKASSRRGEWEWEWIDGDGQLPAVPIRAALLRPTISRSNDN